MKTLTYIKSIFSWVALSLLLVALTSSGPSRVDVTEKPVIRLSIIRERLLNLLIEKVTLDESEFYKGEKAA